MFDRNKIALSVLESNEAVIRNNHFALADKETPPGSGVFRHYHSDTFVLKDRVFENARDLHLLALMIRDQIFTEEKEHEFDFVLGLEKGAIALASHVALHFQKSGLNNIRAGYAEAKKEGVGFNIGRGFARNYKGKKVLIVEDIAVSGTAIRGAIDAVLENGGIPVMAYAICKRGDANTGDVPFRFLCEITGTNVWLEEECPICLDPARGPETVWTDVNKHGQEFLDRYRGAKALQA